MGKIFDFIMADGDWKNYRQILALKEGEELMKTIKEEKLNKNSHIQPENHSPSKYTINKNNSCPKCKKGNMVTTIKSKIGFGDKQIFTSFCPSRGHTIKKIV